MMNQHVSIMVCTKLSISIYWHFSYPKKKKKMWNKQCLMTLYVEHNVPLDYQKDRKNRKEKKI